MEELKGDLIRDERKVVTPRPPFFFFYPQTFAQNFDTSSGSNHILHEAVRYLWLSAHSQS